MTFVLTAGQRHETTKLEVLMLAVDCCSLAPGTPISIKNGAEVRR